MSELVWRNDVDVAQFSEETQIAYHEYKEAQRKAAALRDAFESGVRAEFPVRQGSKLVFGYRFGKLSLAIAPDDSKPKVRASGNLADWIAAQQGNGRAI